MTQRFLPDEWGFYPEDVAALEAGETLPFIRLDMDEDVPTRWHC